MAEALAALRRRDWRPADGLLRGLDVQERETALMEITDCAGRPTWVDDWVEGTDGSALSLLVRGAHSITWAWEARSRLRAQFVEPAAFELFWDRLRAAEDDLLEAARLDPTDPLPWGQLVTSGRGLQIPLEELTGRYEQSQRRHPGMFHASLQYQQGICPKWSGSPELLWQTTGQIIMDAPPGSPLHALLVVAHVEQMIEDGVPSMRGYFRQERVTSDVRAAASRCVDLPTFPRHGTACHARNSFALAFVMMGDTARARQELKIIGDRVTRAQWWVLGDKEPEVIVRDLRRRI